MRSAAALVAVAVMAAAAPAAASEVRAGDLVAESHRYDGLEVTVSGELVGDFQRRGDVAWVQLNDDPYVDRPLREGGRPAGGNEGVGVRLSAAEFDAADLDNPGGYRFRGPVVRVTGVWRHHDESRGGESYLDASSFVVVERERLLDEEMPLGVLVTGLVLLALGAGVPLLRRRRSG